MQQQFIPFEDDWDALENLRPEALIPYRVGLLGTPGLLVQRATHTLPSILSATSDCASVPADNSCGK